MLTVGMISDLPFWHDDRGDRRATQALGLHLARTQHLVLLYIGAMTPMDRQLLSRLYPGVPVHALAAARPPLSRRCAAWLRRRRSRTPPAEPCLRDFESPSTARRVAAVCRRAGLDVLICHYVRLAYLIRATPTACRTMIYTHDVMHDRCSQFHAAGERHWINVTADQERAALAGFDVVMGIHEADSAKLRALLPDRPVITVGYGMPVVPHGRRKGGEVNVLYVGTTAAPNRLAARRFLADVWPSIRARAGDGVHLQVVGDVGGKLRMPLPQGVTIRGYVADMIAVYEEADIVVNPVFFGGGLKIKTVEALCHGKPLLTTMQGAYGLEDGAGRAFWVCGSDAQMRDRLGTLVEDSSARETLAAAALDYARVRFADKSAYGALDLYFGQLENAVA